MLLRRVKIGVLNARTANVQKKYEKANRKEKADLRIKMDRLLRKYNRVYRLKLVKKNNNKRYDWLKKNC